MSGSMISFLLICLAGILVLVGGVMLVARLRRNAVENDRPYCGGCGYDLTGSESNRCPECGQLFIDAGIVRKRLRITSQRTLRLAIPTVVVILLVLFGGATTVLMLIRAQHARAAAEAARAQAMAQFLQKTLAQTKAAEQAANKVTLTELQRRAGIPARRPAGK